MMRPAAALLVAAAAMAAPPLELRSLPEGSISDVPQALAADDECLAGDDSCALNALQLRGASAPANRKDTAIMPTKEPETVASGAGGPRPPEAWANASLHVTTMASEIDKMGYKYVATTTRYGTNCCTACDMDTAAIVAGTNYYAVASAQAMQNMFPGGEGACCRCGRAGPGTGGDSGTAAMGCKTCAKGRFVRRLPRDFHIWTPPDSEIFQREFDIVVGDICPEGDNPMWCPSRPGQENRFGAQNHFDWASPPADFDNFFFVFTPEPCSAEMQQRMNAMSNCATS